MARRPLRIPVPFINQPLPLGNAIARITSAVGIKPCSSCKERAQALNQRVTFVPATPPPAPVK